MLGLYGADQQQWLDFSLVGPLSSHALCSIPFCLRFRRHDLPSFITEPPFQAHPISQVWTTPHFTWPA